VKPNNNSVTEARLENLQVAAISFALSQVVLSMLLLARSQQWVLQQRLYALLMLAIASYLLDPLIDSPASDFVLGSLTVAVPGMFWLFSASLFDDHFRLKPWHLALVATTVLPPLLAKLLHLAGFTALDWLLLTLPQALEFVLLALTLFAVARFWHVDLIESRRRLRLWFCGLNGLYIFILLLLREVFFSGAPWLGTLQFVPVGGMLLATNAILLTYKREIWTVPAKPKASNESAGDAMEAVERMPAYTDAASDTVVATDDNFDEGFQADPELLAKLDHLMQQDKAYREMGLTIGKLANRLDLPEYRLRQTINAGLGYRNFNDFLNRFRVAEAAERLADPAEQEQQVLVIALDAGFRSLSSFNKAFKDSFALTPTAYRRQQLDQ
jgi:AraC-like DNA-binding protein